MIASVLALAGQGAEVAREGKTLRLLLRLWLFCCLAWFAFWGVQHRERLQFYAQTWLDTKSNELDRFFIVSLLWDDLWRLLMQAMVPMTLTLLAMLLGIWLFGSLRQRSQKDRIAN